MKYYHSCATQFENLQNVHNLFLNDDKARLKVKVKFTLEQAMMAQMGK
jgi:hypothetical protein